MTIKQKLITVAVIGFTFGAWFTIDTGGVYAPSLLVWCAGVIVGLSLIVLALSIKTEQPHKRFKNCRRIEL